MADPETLVSLAYYNAFIQYYTRLLENPPPVPPLWDSRARNVDAIANTILHDLLKKIKDPRLIEGIQHAHREFYYSVRSNAKTAYTDMQAVQIDVYDYARRIKRRDLQSKLVPLHLIECRIDRAIMRGKLDEKLLRELEEAGKAARELMQLAIRESVYSGHVKWHF